MARLRRTRRGMPSRNAFAAPPATGCGPSGALNRVVNAVAGLPSAAGTNNAVFQATIEAVNYNDI